MLQQVRRSLKSMPFVKSFLRTESWGRIRFTFLLRTTERVNAHSSAFLRGPMQLEALLGPVLDILLSEDKERHIKFIVAGCSSGSEPFTIASILKTRRPNLSFDIHAFDIDTDMIKMAREGVYVRGQIYNHQKMTDEFVNSTFDKVENRYRIKEEIARHVVFEIDDALDSTLEKRIGKADILFAQNFLYHLPPKASRKAISNLCTLLNPISALFVDGVDLVIRQSVTKSQGLRPLDFKIKEIHNELRSVALSSGDFSNTRGTAWPYQYWGLEPFSIKTKDWKRKYATVFVRDKTAYHFYY